MAQRPTQGTDSAKPSGSDRATPENFTNQSASSTERAMHAPFSHNKTINLSEVAAKFAAHGAGKITAELSGDLALDLVLNEIVEQACLATGASGSAIALRRGDEIVCRATCGTNAPELGTRLQKGSGLSGACVRTGKIQSCNDAWNDDRANADLSRQLGVRSVVVYPLVGSDGEFLGILEILSPLPSAFVARDLETLEVLADRIVKYAEAAKEISLVPENPAPVVSESSPENRPNGDDQAGSQASSPQMQPDLVSTGLSLREAAVDYVVPLEQGKKIDWVTAVLSAIVLMLALVMGVAFGTRMGWMNANDRRSVRPSVNPTSVVSGAAARSAAADATSSASGIAAPETRMSPASAKPVDKKGTAPATEGTLFVYEDGKEIFRMTPQSGHNVATGSNPQLISRVEPEYPAQALAQHIQGAVSLHVQVGADGRVQEVKVAGGNSLLAEAAVAAVRQWRFKPYTSNGQPAESEIEVTLKFTLPAS
jgi:TonB family protein